MKNNSVPDMKFVLKIANRKLKKVVEVGAERLIFSLKCFKSSVKGITLREFFKFGRKNRQILCVSWPRARR